MSNAYRQTRVTCGNDCRMEGCPGHDLELAHHHTSDTVSVNLDGRTLAVFDAQVWDVLVAMEEWFECPEHAMFVKPNRYRNPTPA